MYVEAKLRKLASKSLNGNIFLVCGKKGTPKAKQPRMGNDARGIHIDIAIQKAKQGHVLGYFPRKLGLILLDEDSKLGNKARLDWNPFEIYDSFSRDGGRHYIFHANKESDKLYRKYKSIDGPEKGEVIGRGAAIEYAVLPLPKMNYDAIDSLVDAINSDKKHYIPFNLIVKHTKQTVTGSSLDKAYSLAHVRKYQEAKDMALDLIANSAPGGRNQVLYDSSFFLGRISQSIEPEGLFPIILESCARNGILDEYGHDDVVRQFVSGFSAGKDKPWTEKERKPIAHIHNLDEIKKQQKKKDEEVKKGKTTTKPKPDRVQEVLDKAKPTKPYIPEHKQRYEHIYEPDPSGKGSWFVFIEGIGWKRDIEALQFVDSQVEDKKEFDKLTRDKIESIRERGKLLYGMRPGTEWDSDADILGIPGGKCVNLRTGKLSDQKHSHYIRRTVSTVPDFDNEPVVFLNFINTVMPDKGLQELLLDALSYTLTGYVNEEVSFWCFGDSATGKSSFQEMLQDLMGFYSNVLPDNTLVIRISNRSGPKEKEWRSDLASGARLGIIEEVDDKKYLNESDFKMIVSGNPVRERRLYKGFKSFDSKAKVWLFGNYLPKMTIDDAIKRRIIPLPFNVQIPEALRDSRIKKQLREDSEKAKLLGMLITRAKTKLEQKEEAYKNNEPWSWFPQSKDFPKVCTSFFFGLLRDKDPLQHFIHNYVEKKEDSHTTTDEITLAFKEWSRSRDVQIVSPQGGIQSIAGTRISVGKAMKKKGFTKMRVFSNGRQRWAWINVVINKTNI